MAGAPAGEIPVRIVAQPIPDQGIERVLPLGEPDTVETLPQGRVVKQRHLMATIDTKLK